MGHLTCIVRACLCGFCLVFPNLERNSPMKPATLFASALLACAAAACASAPASAPTAANGANANVTTTTTRTTVRDVAAGNDNEAARRELGEDPFDDSPTTSKRAERAKAAAQEQRDIYRGQATLRLDQANGRIVAAQAKLVTAGARAGTDTRSRVDAAAAQRTLVSQQISQLPIARDDQWSATTKAIDANLQSLDALTAAAVDATDKL